MKKIYILILLILIVGAISSLVFLNKQANNPNRNRKTIGLTEAKSLLEQCKVKDNITYNSHSSPPYTVFELIDGSKVLLDESVLYNSDFKVLFRTNINRCGIKLYEFNLITE